MYQSYLVGLWFSLRTHASQIWSNPQRLLHPLEAQERQSVYRRLVSGNIGTIGHSADSTLPIHGNAQPQSGPQSKKSLRRKDSRVSRVSLSSHMSGRNTPTQEQFSRGPSLTRRPSQGPGIQKSQIVNAYASMYAPIIESVDQAVRSTNAGSDVLELPQHLSTEEFARAVTVATVSALRHPQTIQAPHTKESVLHSGCRSTSPSRTGSKWDC